MTVEDKYTGKVYTVIHCKGALDSFNKALQGLQKGKRASLTKQMIKQIERLADGHRMSKENFPDEGKIRGTGHNGNQTFRALKRIPVRGYCWKSKKHPHTWFVSHYILKKKDPLDNSDIQRVSHNWHRIEIDEDER